MEQVRVYSAAKSWTLPAQQHHPEEVFIEFLLMSHSNGIGLDKTRRVRMAHGGWIQQMA